MAPFDDTLLLEACESHPATYHQRLIWWLRLISDTIRR
jgi:hypothetical protein